MCNLTNEKFMEELERDHPGFDWDSFDIETYPDVWKISAKTHERIYHLDDNESDTRIMDIGISEEYDSEEEALAAIERIKLTTKENLIRKNHLFETYLGPILPDSYQIRKTKSDKAIDLEFKKICREGILEGRKVFPMYLP